MNPRRTRALIQMLDRAGTKDLGESITQTGTVGLIGRQTLPSTKRNGDQDLRQSQNPRDLVQLTQAMMEMSEKEIKRARPPLIQAQEKSCRAIRNSERARIQSKQSQAREVRVCRGMASSSKGTMSTEERLKEMDKTLANLQQMLQHQLDFLENLDVEAGRRLEQLESDITLTKIGFAEELDKLHKELKNPQQEFDERMEQLEAKMAQLNSNWNQEEEK